MLGGIRRRRPRRDAAERGPGDDVLGLGSTRGGNLIAMRPDAELAGLLGLTSRGQRRCRTRYLQVEHRDPARPGHRRPDDPVPRHRRPLHAQRRDRRSRRCTATRPPRPPNPAVTLRDVGASGGQAAAFTYDLARSVVVHPPGQPGVGRPGARRHRRRSAPTTSSSAPSPATIRSRTGSTSTRSPIPQADEQQRLLANLIAADGAGPRMPLPRFWYLPHGRRRPSS